MEEWVLSSGQYRQLLVGLQLTLQVLGLAFLLGVVLSLIFGVLRLAPQRSVRGAALVYVEFARGISSIILLFIMTIAMPILLEIRIDRSALVWLAALALGLNMGGYGAEIVRGAILAVPKGQTEASIALNLSPGQRLRNVTLPQAMRLILPPFGNLTIEILKGTALVSLIGMSDIMQQTRNLIQQQLAAGVAGVTALFLNVLIIYFVVAQVINGLFRFLEWRLERRYRARTGELPRLPADANIAGAGG
jgi:polar amino acid transport system permease protein